MGLRQRIKGKRGESAAAEYLRELGFVTARRVMQSKGIKDGAEVVAAELPNIHIEVKRNEKMDLGTKLLSDALAQATRDCKPDQVPVVLWRRNRTCWRLTWREDAIVTACGDDDIRSTLQNMQSDMQLDETPW